MTIEVALPPKGRDYRLDLLRGLANWAIFLDHIPNNAVNWITQRNYGFSDAADLFVFISGYRASFLYARIMLDRGVVVGGTRLIKRAWQIYVAHIILFVMYLAEIGYLSRRYKDPSLQDAFNVAGFMHDPAETLYQGLILAFKPVNMDVLPPGPRKPTKNLPINLPAGCWHRDFKSLDTGGELAGRAISHAAFVHWHASLRADGMARNVTLAGANASSPAVVA
jgi:hypothetical protein